MNSKIKIQEKCIQILDAFGIKVIYTIWDDDYETFEKAFQDSRNYKKEMDEVRGKYR